MVLPWKDADALNWYKHMFVNFLLTSKNCSEIHQKEKKLILHFIFKWIIGFYFTNYSVYKYIYFFVSSWTSLHSLDSSNVGWSLSFTSLSVNNWISWRLPSCFLSLSPLYLSLTLQFSSGRTVVTAAAAVTTSHYHLSPLLVGRGYLERITINDQVWRTC